jgi:hypothetical protein
MLSILLSFLVIAALPDIAPACCMVPRDFPGRISQRTQEAVIIHHDGREELILGIDYRITGAETMPEQFAWVITVPNEPDAYATVDRALFADMGRLARTLLAPPSSRRLAAGGGVDLGQHVKVGPYDIQPVRAVGKAALADLNVWLETNGFPTEDPAHMRYFVEAGFTFLCIRITPEPGRREVETGGPLPALQLSFASEHPYYPLRFSSRQGVFDVRMHLLTTVSLDYRDDADTLKRMRWSNRDDKRNVALTPADVPDRLAAAYAQGRAEAPTTATWIYNYIEGHDVNADNAIATWEDDVKFASLTR